jgi:hypothetical protein
VIDQKKRFVQKNSEAEAPEFFKQISAVNAGEAAVNKLLTFGK